MSEQSVIEYVQKNGLILPRGHFVSLDGRLHHSSYVDKGKILSNFETIRRIATALTNNYKGGTYTKTQSSLLPGDTMSVTGTFAEHPALLFLKEVFITLLILAAIAVGSVLGYRYYRKKHPKANKPLEGKSDASASSVDSTEAKAAKSEVDANTAKEVLQTASNVQLAVISLIAIIAASVLTIAGGAVFEMILQGCDMEVGCYISNSLYCGGVCVYVYGVIV